jgi:hypothetical protein
MWKRCNNINGIFDELERAGSTQEVFSFYSTLSPDCFK